MPTTTGMNVIVTETYDEMSQKAAEMMAGEINKKPDACFGFATGSTPAGMYKALVNMNKKGLVDFSKATTFNLDEYYPIKKANDQSYDYFMKQQLFNHVNVDLGRIHLPDGEAEDPQAECLRYEALIQEAGGIHLQLLGIGQNGHIGFNEPADSFTKRTNLVVLTESTINANKRFFANEADVPRKALTMGIGTIMKAKKILMIISGGGKKGIVKDFLTGDITPRVPASVLQLHPDVTVILDREAAALL